MTKTREQIIKTIQALRARAADAASTEAEAAIAARRAQQLLERHNITLTEADVREEGVTKAEWKSGQVSLPVAAWAFSGVDKACGTKTLHSRGTLVIYGAPADVEVALYYYDLVTNACQATWASFQRTEQYHGFLKSGQSPRTIGSDFRKGVAVRLGERIKAQAVEEKAVAPSAAGNALVVVKHQLINQFIADAGIKLGKRGGTHRVNASGYSAGRAAAEGVGLHKGVGSTRTGRLQLT